MAQFPDFILKQIVSVDPNAGAGTAGLPNEFLIRTDVPSLYFLPLGAGPTGWVKIGLGGGVGGVIQTIVDRLLVDVTSVAVPPIYSTLFTTVLTSVSPTSLLWIGFTAGARHSGAGLGNVAINFRFRLNGVLIAPGGGITNNMVRDQIKPFAYSVRLPIVAGVQTVNVEWGGFALAPNTMLISPVTLPDLNHAELILQEQSL